MFHCATLFASLSRMKSSGWARKCLLAFGLVVSAACGAEADRARDIPITSVPYGNNKVGNYYTVFGGSETLITASAVDSLLNRGAREYRLKSEKGLSDEQSIDLPDKTSWSATYWLYRAQQRNFLFVADKYSKETVLGAQMDTGHKADAEIRQWREDTLDQIDAHCASRTTASSFQIRDSMNAVELLGLQLECQESLFGDLGGQYSGEDIETLSNNLDEAVLDFYGHTAWHTEEHTAWRTEDCDGLVTTTEPTSTTLYNELGEDFSTARPSETIFPCTDETGTIPVWFMWQTHSQNVSFEGKCYCGGKTDTECTSFQFCHASRDSGKRTTRAFCNYAPTCPESLINNANSSTNEVFEDYERSPLCGLVMHGLSENSSEVDFNTLNGKWDRYIDPKIKGILRDYGSFENDTGGVYETCTCGANTCSANQYCYPQGDPQGDPKGVCSNAPLVQMRRYTNPLDLSEDVTAAQATALQDGVRAEDPERLCGDNLCSIGDLCDNDYGCMPLQTYNLSNNLSPRGYLQCPKDGFPWYQSAQSAHNITECLCKGKLCGKNQICLPAVNGVLPGCYDAPPCNNYLAQSKCRNTYCNNFGGCACGAAPCSEHCAHFNGALSSYDESYQCFSNPVSLCPDVHGKEKLSTSCYCGEISANNPVCAPNHYCMRDRDTNVHSCVPQLACKNTMTNLPEPAECFCGVQSTKGTTCQQGQFCYKHPSGDYDCSASGGSVFRVAANGASLDAETSRARGNFITFGGIQNVLIGCRDPTACNYDPNFDYDSRSLGGTCKYPEFGKTCDGDCIITPPSNSEWDKADGCVSEYQPQFENGRRYIDGIEGNLSDIPDNNYPNRLFDVQVPGGDWVQVPITNVATQYYGCPTDTSDACNGLYDFNLGGGYYDQPKSWHEKFCIYPPENYECAGNPATFNDNYHNYERHVSTLFAGQQSAHVVYECDINKCNYHPNPDKVTEYCSPPGDGLSCEGKPVVHNFTQAQTNEVADCPAGYTEVLTGTHINIRGGRHYTTRTCQMQTTDTEELADLYHYFDAEFSDHTLDERGERRRLRQKGRKLYSTEVAKALFKMHKEIVCTHDTNGTHCAPQPVRESTTTYQEVKTVQQATQIKSNKDTQAKKDYVERTYAYDNELKLTRDVNTVEQIFESNGITKEDVNSFWDNRTTGVPPASFFKTDKHGNSKYGETGSNPTPMYTFAYNFATNGGTSTHAPGFWKRAFSKESNTVAVEWTARTIVQKEGQKENAFPYNMHLHAPNFAKQEKFHDPDVSEALDRVSLPADCEQISDERYNPVIKKCGWPTEISSQSVDNTATRLAHFGPEVTAVHHNNNDGWLTSVSHLLRYDFYGWECVSAGCAEYFPTISRTLGTNCFARTMQECGDSDECPEKLWYYHNYGSCGDGEEDPCTDEEKLTTTRVWDYEDMYKRSRARGQYFKETTTYTTENYNMKELWRYTGRGERSCEHIREPVWDFIQWEKAKGYHLDYKVKITQTKSMCKPEFYSHRWENFEIYFDNGLGRRYDETGWTTGETFSFGNWLTGLTKREKNNNNNKSPFAMGTLPEGMKGDTWDDDGWVKGKQAYLGSSGSKTLPQLHNVVVKDWYDGPDQCIKTCLDKNFPSALYRLHGLYGIDWHKKYTVKTHGKKANTLEWGDDVLEEPGNIPTHATCYCYTTPFVSGVVEIDKREKYEKKAYACDSSDEHNNYRSNSHKSLYEHFDVTYTFSCEAGTYYNSGSDVRMDNKVPDWHFKCAQCAPGKFSLESFPVHVIDDKVGGGGYTYAWGYLKGPECEECPIGSEPVTMLGHTYKAYRDGETIRYDKEGNAHTMTSEEIKEASHASMCKECPPGRADGRLFGFNESKGCMITPKTRTKQFTFEQKKVSLWYCTVKDREYCPEDKFCKPKGDCGGCKGLYAVSDTRECIQATGGSCSKDGKMYCPNTKKCVSDCSGCTDYTASPTSDNTCKAPSDATCSALSKKFCPGTQKCVSDCSGCTDYTASPTSGNTCKAPSDQTCSANNQKYCPYTEQCVSDCSGCTGHTASPASDNTCKAPSDATCNTNNKYFCLGDNLCKESCSECAGYTVLKGTVCSPCNVGEYFCPDTKTCVSDCSSKCGEPRSDACCTPHDTSTGCDSGELYPSNKANCHKGYVPDLNGVCVENDHAASAEMCLKYFYKFIWNYGASSEWRLNSQSKQGGTGWNELYGNRAAYCPSNDAVYYEYQGLGTTETIHWNALHYYDQYDETTQRSIYFNYFDTDTNLLTRQPPAHGHAKTGYFDKQNAAEAIQNSKFRTTIKCSDGWVSPYNFRDSTVGRASYYEYAKRFNELCCIDYYAGYPVRKNGDVCNTCAGYQNTDDSSEHTLTYSLIGTRYVDDYAGETGMCYPSVCEHPKVICPADGSCKESCSSCAGFPYEGLSENFGTCVVASASICFKAGMYYCPSSETCVSDCGSCNTYNYNSAPWEYPEGYLKSGVASSQKECKQTEPDDCEYNRTCCQTDDCLARPCRLSHTVYCPGTEQCVSDCSDCEGYSFEATALSLCKGPSGTTCDKLYCPDTEQCVAACSGCPGLPQEGDAWTCKTCTLPMCTCASGDTCCQTDDCRADRCADNNKKYCPTARSKGKRCVSACAECDGYTAPGNKLCAEPSDATCGSNNQKYCPHTEQCVAGCLECHGYNYNSGNTCVEGTRRALAEIRAKRSPTVRGEESYSARRALAGTTEEHPCALDTNAGDILDTDTPQQKFCETGVKKTITDVQISVKQWIQDAADFDKGTFTTETRHYYRCPYDYEPDWSYYYADPSNTPKNFAHETRCIPCNKGSAYHTDINGYGYPMCSNCPYGKFNLNHDHRIALDFDRDWEWKQVDFTYRMSPVKYRSGGSKAEDYCKKILGGEATFHFASGRILAHCQVNRKAWIRNKFLLLYTNNGAPKFPDLLNNRRDHCVSVSTPRTVTTTTRVCNEKYNDVVTCPAAPASANFLYETGAYLTNPSDMVECAWKENLNFRPEHCYALATKITGGAHDGKYALSGLYKWKTSGTVGTVGFKQSPGYPEIIDAVESYPRPESLHQRVKNYNAGSTRPYGCYVEKIVDRRGGYNDVFILRWGGYPQTWKSYPSNSRMFRTDQSYSSTGDYLYQKIVDENGGAYESDEYAGILDSLADGNSVPGRIESTQYDSGHGGCVSQHDMKYFHDNVNPRKTFSVACICPALALTFAPCVEGQVKGPDICSKVETSETVQDMQKGAVWSKQALTSYEYHRQPNYNTYYQWKATGPLQLCPEGTDMHSNTNADIRKFDGTVEDGETNEFSLASYKEGCKNIEREFETEKQRSARCDKLTDVQPQAGDIWGQRFKNGYFGAKLYEPGCYACPKGKYTPGTNDCKLCPVGFYQDEKGGATCKLCDAGKFTRDGDEFTSGTGKKYTVDEAAKKRTACQTCTPHIWRLPRNNYVHNGQNCWLCQVGKYLKPAEHLSSESKKMLDVESNDNYCRECAPGSWNKVLGASSCKKCPPGKAELLEIIPLAPTSASDTTQRVVSINPSSPHFNKNSPAVKGVPSTTDFHSTWSYAPTDTASDVAYKTIQRTSYTRTDGNSRVTVKVDCPDDVTKEGDPNCFKKVRDGVKNEQKARELLRKQWVTSEYPSGSELTRNMNWSPHKGNGRVFYSIDSDYIQGNPKIFAHPRSLNQCAECPPGYYQDQEGQSWGVVSVKEGKNRRFVVENAYEFANLLKSASPTGEELPIPVDLNLEGGTHTTTLLGCKRCAKGTYGGDPGRDTECSLCPEGYSTNDEEAAWRCTACPSAKYSDYNQGVEKCTTCPAGWGQPLTGQNLCKPCVSGRYADNGVCKNCAPGQFQDENLKRACKLCTGGRYSNVTGNKGLYLWRSEGGGAWCENACEPGWTTMSEGSTLNAHCKVPCPIGRYSSGFDCLPCNYGTYSDRIGQGSCKECPRGTYMGDDGSLGGGGAFMCITCPKGKDSALAKTMSAQTCSQCGVGKVKPKTKWVGDHDPDVYLCVNVQAGLYQNEAGKATGNICGAGEYSDEDGLTACKTCPKGYFQDPENPIEKLITPACDACPRGRYGDQTGIESEDVGKKHCKPCAAGKYSTFPAETLEESCVNCAAGFYSPLEAQWSCEICERGRYQALQAQANCTFCPSGFFSSDEGNTNGNRCKACQGGFITDENGGAASCDICARGYGYNPDTDGCDPCNSTLGLWNDASAAPVRRGGVCKTIVCPNGEGFSATKAKKISLAANIGGLSSEFCEPCRKGKYRNALASTSEGHEDVCQNTTVAYPPTEQQKSDLGFGEYYSYVPFADTIVKTATMCRDCGVSFCFKQRLEDGGRETCKSWEGRPDFSVDFDFFGEDKSRCEQADLDISSVSIVPSSVNNDFCTTGFTGCADRRACNYDSSVSFHGTKSCKFPAANAYCNRTAEGKQSCNLGFSKKWSEEKGVECVPIGARDGDSVKKGQLKQTVQRVADRYYNDDRYPTIEDKLYGFRNYAVHLMHELKKKRDKGGAGWFYEEFLDVRQQLSIEMEGSHTGPRNESDNRTRLVIFGPDNAVHVNEVQKGLDYEEENCPDSPCVTFDLSKQNLKNYAYKYMLGCDVGCWNVLGHSATNPLIRQIGIERGKYAMACWDKAGQGSWTNEVVLYKGDTYKCNEEPFLIGSTEPKDFPQCQEAEVKENRDPCNENEEHTRNDGCYHSLPYRYCDNVEDVSLQGRCKNDTIAPYQAHSDCRGVGGYHNGIYCNDVCDEEEVLGCTTETYPNDYPQRARCSYNPDATYNDGLQCISHRQFIKALLRLGDGDDDLYALNRAKFLNCEGKCRNNEINSYNDLCDEEEVEGCMDPEACNYDEKYTYNDDYELFGVKKTQCEYAGLRDLRYRDCNATCNNDNIKATTALGGEVGSDNICDELQVSCHNHVACNYDEDHAMLRPISNESMCVFVTRDGVELNRSIWTCWDDTTKNTNGACQRDDDTDGMCDELEVEGCRDSNGCNFIDDDTTNENNDLCVFPHEYRYCNPDNMHAKGACITATPYEGFCEEEVQYGCMNPISCNYDENATHDNAEYNEECTFENEGDYEYRDCNGICISDTIILNNTWCDEEEEGGCIDPENEEPENGVVACNVDDNDENKLYHNESMCRYSSRNQTCNGLYQIVLKNPLDGEYCTDLSQQKNVHLIWPDSVKFLYRSATPDCTDGRVLIAENINTEFNASLMGLKARDDRWVSINTIGAAPGESHWITDCNASTSVDFQITCTGTSGCMEEGYCNYNPLADHTPSGVTCQVNDWCGVCGGSTKGGVRDADSCPEEYYTGCNPTGQSDACNKNSSKRLHDSAYCEYPTARRCLNPCPEEGTCLDMSIGGCWYDNDDTVQGVPYSAIHIADNNVCNQDERGACMTQGACNVDSSAHYHVSEMCQIPGEESNNYKHCNGTCVNNEVNPGNNLCDEEEIHGCIDPEACNYDPAATYNTGVCNPKDCNNQCTGADTGPYSYYWENSDAVLELKSDCCADRDCFGDCADGKHDYPQKDCSGECNGTSTNSYSIGDNTFQAGDCCDEDDRDCSNVCYGEKETDALGECLLTNHSNFCKKDADDDNLCDHNTSSADADPCVRDLTLTNVDFITGLDCKGECNGLNRDNYMDRTDCCLDDERDCKGVCYGTAVRLDSNTSDLGDLGACCDGIKTKTNQCCRGDDEEDLNGDCCTDMGCDNVCGSGKEEQECGCGKPIPFGHCDCDGGTLDLIGNCSLPNSTLRCLLNEDNDNLCDHATSSADADPCVRNSTTTDSTTGLDCKGVCNGPALLDKDVPQQCCLFEEMGCDGVCFSGTTSDCNNDCGGSAEPDCSGECITENTRFAEGYVARVDVNPKNDVCDDAEVTGCFNASACNYNPSTSISDERLCFFKNVDTSYTKGGILVNQNLKHFNCPTDAALARISSGDLSSDNLLSGGCIDENPDNGYCDEPYEGDKQEKRGCSLHSEPNACTKSKEGEEQFIAGNDVTIHDATYCRFAGVRDCEGKCVEGDQDQDGTCDEEDLCVTSNPCQNNATCTDVKVEPGVKCDCADGWGGSNCDERPSCSENHKVCLNGKVDTKLKVPNCQCLCNPGYQLIDGECKDINECLSNPCVHGDCTDSTTNSNVAINAHACECKNGFSFDEAAKSCTICKKGFGWNEVDGDGASCDACVFPYTQSNTGRTHRCENQKCPGGKQPVGLDEFSTELDPNTDNANCEPCLPGYSSPQGTSECKEIQCPNTMKRITNLDQALHHESTLNCEFKDCSEYSESPTCSRGTLTGDVALGTCQCDCGDSGYGGTTCDDDINECASGEGSPCKNGGNCTTPVINAYHCDCPAGWTGPTCEDDIDECAPSEGSPCKNGGTCTDSTNSDVAINAYHCDCLASWTGDTCKDDVDECDLNKDGDSTTDDTPCAANANCKNNAGGYECTCKNGYTIEAGVCVDILECSGTPCNSNQNCIEKTGHQVYPDGYICECKQGFSGPTCGTNDDDCASNPCQHGGTCHDGVNSYTCTCAAGWTGLTCENDVDECASNPCYPDQRCFNLVGNSTAVCRDKTCTSSDLNCEHGELIGDIVFPDEPSGGWTDAGDITRDTQNCNCACQTDGGVSGASDGFVKRTIASPGHAVGSCTVCPAGDGFDSGACVQCTDKTVNDLDTYTAECATLSCDAGYGQTSDGWDYTDISTDSGNCVACTGNTTSPGGQGQCAEIACNPGSKPKSSPNRTLEHTSQDNCEDILECEPNPCQHGGTCTEGVNAFTCACAAGWNGTTCTDDVDDCTPSSCSSGQKCVNNIGAPFTCEDINECAPSEGNPCQHGGTCTDGVNAFTCACAPGYSGGTCATNDDDCASNPCKNEGTCHDGVNSYTCACATGWTGDTCEEDVVDCPADACGSHGNCTEGTNTYSCNCDSGYEPTGSPDAKTLTCTNINDCAPSEGNPCQHGGNCTDGVNAFTCACAPGYSGGTCGTNDDDCAPNPCKNGGNCTDKVNAFTCACAAGWTGDTCEEDVVDCPAKSITVWISSGSETSPYYNFYTNEACTQTLSPDELQAHTEYTFKRCPGSGNNHPFAVQISGTTYSGNLVEGGELKISMGLPNSQRHWKCTSHGGMTGYFTAVEGVCVHGNCIEDKNSYSCDCNEGYEGTYCDTVISCTKGANGQTCLNGGQPTGDIPTGCGCNCEDTGYKGPNCENLVDHCENVDCVQGTCVSENEGYTCNCYPGFGKEDGVCTTCQAGWGWNGVTGTGSECVECKDTQANHLTTHTAQCVDQRCKPGYGVVKDSEFSHFQNWNDDDNDKNCELCINGMVSPGYSGVCVSIVCPVNKIPINNYDNTKSPSDPSNCVCRNDHDGDGECDEAETQICTDTSACNTAADSADGVHSDNQCYYAGSLNSQYEPDMNLKHADCQGVCNAGFDKENGICTVLSSVTAATAGDTLSEIRNSHTANLVERQAQFIEVFKVLVNRESLDEGTKTQAQKRYDSRIEIIPEDLPGMPENKTQKIASILQAKTLKLKMVVSPCTANPDTCATYPTATDDSCVTANLDDDIQSSDLTRYVMENVGCWQVFGTDDGPIAKQTKTNDGYSWACWESGWSTSVTQQVGDEYTCNSRTFLTGSSTDVTTYGCTEARTLTKNCNYDSDAQVNDGCTHANQGYDCDGNQIDASVVCTVVGCTDTELVSAYQSVSQSCGEQGDHTSRAQCTTTGCNTTQLEAAFAELESGQCFQE